MKNTRNILLVYSIILLITSCDNDKIKFKPTDEREVQSIEISDGDEVALLRQELGLDIKMVQGNKLYYFVKGSDQEQKLKDIGYSIKTEDIMQINYRVVQLSIKDRAPDNSKTEELKKYGVQIINKEKNYWVVRGSLEQLNNIQRLDYKLKIETKEPRPRHVEIVVKSEQDIQKVNELGVDIYSSKRSDRQRTIIIYAGAFDYQIEQIQELGYEVTLKNN